VSLKHLTRVKVSQPNGQSEVVWINDDGIEVFPLTRFREHLYKQGLKPTTRKRYEEAASRFVDYLIECGVFGQVTTPIRIGDALDLFPVFLRDGAKVRAPEFPTLNRYADEVGMSHGLTKGGMLPTIAAVNRFLALAKDEALRITATLESLGVSPNFTDLSLLFQSVSGFEAWTEMERERFRQNSVMGGVVRIKSKLLRPKGLRSAIRGGKQVDLENREFPIHRFSHLLTQTRSHRDKALWSLLAGGGIRVSEACNIRMSDFDPVTGEIWVIDPELRRFGREMTDRQRLRFKGRTMSRVYLYEPLKSVFWSALSQYLKLEYVATGDHDYLFQKIDGQGRGDPLLYASDTALQKQFKKAVQRAEVPGPPEFIEYVWTLHSLRHAYGVYMLNYIPVPGGPGLLLSEVNTLMGHSDINTTAKYARHDKLILEARIEAADHLIYGSSGGPNLALSSLPKVIADRLRRAADEIESSGSANVSPLAIQY
jgi:integrase